MKKKKTIDTQIIDRAICFATKAHEGVVRKGTDVPYIVHPLEALAIVATITSDQELMAAAVLHDVVEDAGINVDDIRREFGQRVADLVDAESDREVPGLSHVESWQNRKQATIDRLAAAGRDTQIVALGDKLSNMRAIARDYSVKGDDFWNIFHAKDPKDHEWHYRGLAESLRELSDTFAYKEFEQLINQVFHGSD